MDRFDDRLQPEDYEITVRWGLRSLSVKNYSYNVGIILEIAAAANAEIVWVSQNYSA